MQAPEPSSDRRKQDILRHALTRKTPQERIAFLDGACGDDVALRVEMEALLAGVRAEREATELTPTLLDETPVTEGAGTVIGRYKLLEQIGEGGFGVVYVAEQQEPVRRQVALKIIKLGMDTRQVVARFEAERQALALMDHPHIAKVFDAGATDTGRLFFVMELVKGIPITQYCDQEKLGTSPRLDLFIKVCQAVQHAHQKGIIHRDIKPSNILVTVQEGTPVPKVIDFGIAKATQQKLTEKTLHTQLQQFIGTPAYMSPEQAEMSGLDIDTRSDIYALGVLLYELLTGQTPFGQKELVAAGLEEMRRIIREKEPVRPSTCLSTLEHAERTTVAKRRHSEPPKLIHLLRGDLDWIVMKALEKDRTRRYDTVNGLAMDIQRHLNNEPVLARPPSSTYRIQKLLRRNKVVSTAVVLVLTAILMGTVVSIAQTLRARRELRRALAAEAQAQVEKAKAFAEKANAQAALHFIQDDVLSQASPGYQADRDLKVRTLLDLIAERLNRAAGRPPLVEASIRQTLGSVYTELGDYAKAIQHYETALRIQREQLGESNPDTLRSLYGLAMARWWNGDMTQAEPLTRRGLEESRRVLGEKHPLTLQFMQARGFTLLYLGETPWTELDQLFLQTLALHREVLGPDDSATLRLIYGLSLGYVLNWQAAKAEPLLLDAIDRSRRVLSEKHPLTCGLMSGLALIYLKLNQFEKAEPLALHILELRRSILGEDHDLTIGSALILAEIYVQQQQFDKAQPLVDQALKLSRRLPIENTRFLPFGLSNLGWDYLEQGQVAKADTLCELALQAVRRKPDANPVVNPHVISTMGAVRLAQQRYVEAETLLSEGSRLAEKHWPDAAYRFYVTGLLGASLSGQKKYSDAEPLLLQGCQGLRQRQARIPNFLNARRRITESLERLVQLYDAWDKPAQAAEWKGKLAEFQQTAKAAQKNGP